MKSQDIGHLVKEEVLIVAKCIVNSFDLLMVVIIMFVLIVAKCIVNDY